MEKAAADGETRPAYERHRLIADDSETMARGKVDVDASSASEIRVKGGV